MRGLQCAVRVGTFQRDGFEQPLSVATTMAEPAVDGRKELDWDLHINVPTQGVRKSVRVTSDESVGALMIKIAEKLGERRFRL